MRTARRYCGCGNPLARDNPATICAACHDRREAVRAPEVPSSFWQTEVMAAALASGDLGRMLRAYRSHPFHGHRPLPQTVIAGWLHVSQMTVSRIEQGKRRLTIDEINRFADGLAIPMTLRWLPHHEAGEYVDSLSRRSLFGAGAGAALSLSATTAPAAAHQIDPELVDHWMMLLRVLNRHDARFGPHEAFAIVRHQLGVIAQHRRIARGELRSRLLRVEARWSDFAGWLSDDIGDEHMHDHWLNRALRLARESDDQGMVAWVHMLQSRDAASHHDPERAIALAQTAHDTRGTTRQSRALSAFRIGHGHAVAHDEASFERSLANAHSLLDGLGQAPPEDLGSEDVTPAYVTADEARCWLLIRPRKAIAVFEDALRLWPSHRMRGCGLHRARLALACSAAGEPDRAAVEGVEALDIARTTRSDLTMRELTRLDRRLASCDAPAAEEFREAFTTL
jgi:transcriptional regulator with XRE-family HTH domain